MFFDKPTILAAILINRQSSVIANQVPFEAGLAVRVEEAMIF
jgi:hypothetical protein